MRKSGLAAALAACLLSGLPATAAPRAPVGLGNAFPMACASGYHTDVGGNCQPNAGEQSRFCPAGTVYQPTYEGWVCNPPPPEAY
jgi:hypothetical protein